MAADIQIKCRVVLAWWVKPYIHTVAFLCAITGQEPNLERTNYWVTRGVTIKLNPSSWYDCLSSVAGMTITGVGTLAGYLLARWWL